MSNSERYMLTVSNTYTLSYLAKQELTKDIIFKYLKSLLIDEDQIENIDATLQELYTYNMGGGIPHNVIVDLMAELDRLPVPLEQPTSIHWMLENLHNTVPKREYIATDEEIEEAEKYLLEDSADEEAK